MQHLLMQHLVNVLAEIEWTQRDIPWAGIAAVLAGTGSFLTGFAALKAASKRGSNDEDKTKKTNTSDSPSD